jgi:O-antigen ligase
MRRHIRLIQFLGVTVCLPALILPDAFPQPVLGASLIGIGVMALLGALVTRRPFLRTPPDIPMWLLGLVAGLNLLISANPALTLPHVTKTIAGIAVAYAVAGLLSEKRWFGLAGWAICLLGLALIPFVLFGTHWSGTSKLSWMPWTISKELAERLQALWGPPADYKGFNVNLAGGALALVLPVPLAYALFSRNVAVKIGATLETAVIGVLLLFTQSRGALVGLAAATAVMLSARNWRWILVIALIAGAGGTTLRQTDLLDRLISVDLESDLGSAVNSAAGRLEIWSRGVYAAQDHPFTGIGMGLALDVIPRRYPYFNLSVPTKIDHLHSLYFNTLAETGIPGLIAMLAFLMSLLSHLWSSGRNAPVNSPLQPLILGLLGTTVVVCVHGFADTIFFSPKAYLITWALFGVAIAAGMHSDDKVRRGTTDL